MGGSPAWEECQQRSMITPVVEAAIVAEAEREYPNEACGFVIVKDGETFIIPAANIARDPKQDFEISAEAERAAEAKGTIYAIYHSHPDAECGLTDTDLRNSEATGYRYVCVGYPQLGFAMHTPGLIDLPYVGRQFNHGLVDCYTLIRDYYIRELGIKFPNYYRKDDWWEKGENLYVDNFVKNGFAVVDDLKKHDLILFAIRSRVCNHAGVFVGDGLMLHHLYGRLSCHEAISRFTRMRRMNLRHVSQ